MYIRQCARCFTFGPPNRPAGGYWNCRKGNDHHSLSRFCRVLPLVRLGPQRRVHGHNLHLYGQYGMPAQSPLQQVNAPPRPCREAHCGFCNMCLSPPTSSQLLKLWFLSWGLELITGDPEVSKVTWVGWGGVNTMWTFLMSFLPSSLPPFIWSPRFFPSFILRPTFSIMQSWCHSQSRCQGSVSSLAHDAIDPH